MSLKLELMTKVDVLIQSGLMSLASLRGEINFRRHYEKSTV